MGEYDEDIDDFDPCLFEGLVDEGAEKEARHYEAEEGEGEAKVWVFCCITIWSEGDEEAIGFEKYEHVSIFFVDEGGFAHGEVI